MSPWRAPRASEIACKIQDDIGRRLKESYGIASNITDPALSVLIRAFALQIEEIYAKANETIPTAVLDELVAALGMRERRARPAQLVVKFSLPAGRIVMEEGTALIGETGSGERLVFALDSAIQVSSASIVFAAAYEDRALRLISGVSFPAEFENVRPSLQPARADLGPMPAVFLAIDLPDNSYLDHHGLYFELAPNANELSAALRRELWCVLDHSGAVSWEGLLRPCHGRGGVAELRSLSEDCPTAGFVADGFYGDKTFVFPQFSSDRRFASAIPRKMETALQSIYGEATTSLFGKKRAWIKIGFPGCRNLNENIVRIGLHCVAASNLELLNQTLHFKQSGTSIPVSNEAGTSKHLVKPISIVGETGIAYLPESQPSTDSAVGRYRLRRGRIEISPAQFADGRTDRHATLRLLVSDGARANGVPTGSVKTFLYARNDVAHLTLTNITAAAGGADIEASADARVRFAEMLLCRSRVVTPKDLEVAVRAFEPKVSTVRIRPSLERTLQGLRRIHQVTVAVPKDSFLDACKQSRVLQAELERHLRERMLIGADVRVAVEWV